jgi:hypothetical protein
MCLSFLGINIGQIIKMIGLFINQLTVNFVF